MICHDDGRPFCLTINVSLIRNIEKQLFQLHTIRSSITSKTISKLKICFNLHQIRDRSLLSLINILASRERREQSLDFLSRTQERAKWRQIVDGLAYFAGVFFRTANRFSNCSVLLKSTTDEFSGDDDAVDLGSNGLSQKQASLQMLHTGWVVRAVAFKSPTKPTAERVLGRFNGEVFPIHTRHVTAEMNGAPGVVDDAVSLFGSHCVVENHCYVAEIHRILVAIPVEMDTNSVSRFAVVIGLWGRMEPAVVLGAIWVQKSVEFSNCGLHLLSHFVRRGQIEEGFPLFDCPAVGFILSFAETCDFVQVHRRGYSISMAVRKRDRKMWINKTIEKVVVLEIHDFCKRRDWRGRLESVVAFHSNRVF